MNWGFDGHGQLLVRFCGELDSFRVQRTYVIVNEYTSPVQLAMDVFGPFSSMADFFDSYEYCQFYPWTVVMDHNYDT